MFRITGNEKLAVEQPLKSAIAIYVKLAIWMIIAGAICLLFFGFAILMSKNIILTLGLITSVLLLFSNYVELRQQRQRVAHLMNHIDPAELKKLEKELSTERALLLIKMAEKASMPLDKITPTERLFLFITRIHVNEILASILVITPLILAYLDKSSVVLATLPSSLLASGVLLLRKYVSEDVAR